MKFKDVRQGCGICGDVLKADDEVNVDHLIPQSYGGPRQLWNERIVHASCNRKRGNAILPVQIPLLVSRAKPVRTSSYSHSKSVRAYQFRQMAKGLCYSGDGALATHGERCDRCWTRHNVARMRRYYNAQAASASHARNGASS